MGEAFTTQDSDFEGPANVSIPSRQRPIEDVMDDIRGSKNLSEAVHVSLGAASVCWENMSGTGVFQSERALAIGQALTDYIHEHKPGVTISEDKEVVNIDGINYIKQPKHYL